eukprot:CAMPEP_0176488462 /NCGR_PEP_ID=MMETSP0200_2-20121128/6723_1 /TAXON_ID=947934 /ORGANISM="Chaetoceros sp., Strain GSL56" /LENGTH=343 /DNA_ID=CAMNT_0017885449 /DNA_START=112 /DNA_END=1143 /DNA_ORIENTATION=-
MSPTPNSLTALLIVSSLVGSNAFLSTHHSATQVSFRPFSSATQPLFVQRNGRPRGPVRTFEVRPPMNEEIKYDQVRVSIPDYTPTSSGKPAKDQVLGIMSKAEALAKAKELGGLDVILINENSDPPVVKIVEYSKFRYEKEKKAKELKKNSKSTEIKEVKMTYKIDVHDYGVRIKNASKFIQQGNRVKCTVQFKGREVQHDNLGFDLLNRMAEDMNKICIMEGKPKREGRNLSCILSPRPEVTKAVNDKKRASEKEKKKMKLQGKDKKSVNEAVLISGQTNSMQEEMEQGDFDDDDEDEDDELEYDQEVDDDDDEEDEDDDDDDDVSLDSLFGSNTSTDELFK